MHGSWITASFVTTVSSFMEQKQAQVVLFLLNINFLFIELRYWLKFVALIMSGYLCDNQAYGTC